MAEKSREVRTLSQIPEITALLGLSIGLIYALGFVVVNSYYASFNYVSIKTLDYRVFAAGFFFIVTILPPAAVAYFVKRAEKKKPQKLTGKWPLFSLAVALPTFLLFSISKTSPLGTNRLMFLFFLYLILVFFLEYLGSKKTELGEYAKSLKPLTLVVPLFAFGLFPQIMFVAFVLFLFLEYGLIPRLVESIKKRDLLLLGFDLLLMGFLTLPLTGIFGRSIYPKIKRQYGGGEPVKVKIEGNLQGVNMEELYLLDETDSWLIFLTSEDTSKGEVIKVRDDLVKNIYYIRETSQEKRDLKADFAQFKDKLLQRIRTVIRSLKK